MVDNDYDTASADLSRAIFDLDSVDVIDPDLEGRMAEVKTELESIRAVLNERAGSDNDEGDL